MKWILLLALFASCHHTAAPLPTGTATPATYFTAALADSHFVVAEHMRASIEMQLTGEPFAQLLGRNLAGYDRFNRDSDLYFDPATGGVRTDVLGYSTAIESYEYSKQPMNQLSFESGGGLSLMYGPLLNSAQISGDAAYQLLLDRLVHLANLSNAGGPPGTAFVNVPVPVDNPLNVYGWPGYWPVFAEFRSYATDIAPATGATQGCALAAGYAAAAAGTPSVGTYECGYISLNLPNRDTAVEKVLEPAALGHAAWKQGLWVINYWQSLHDVQGNSIIEVDDANLANVGALSNKVVGRYADPGDPTGKRLIDGVEGTYFGVIAIEGWQGLTMLDELDNKTVLLLRSATTSDGVQLGGFASVKAGIDYDYQAPLSWWPHAISVTEQTTSPPATGEAWKHFPRPTQFAVKDPKSTLRDLTGLLGGFAEFYALTDGKNADVGGLVGPRATFDGDPFAADNQLADGEDSPHDRTLAIMKVALVNLDRIHFDPTNQVLVDEATIAGQITRGGKITTVETAYAIVSLRNAARALSSTLTLYSNDTPDAPGTPGILDGARLRGGVASLSARLNQLVAAEANFLADRLISSDGKVANGYDLASNSADPSPTTLESEASAIRGLLEAHLASGGDERFRQAAQRVYEDLERRFWMPEVRVFRTTVGADNELRYTPGTFGALQGALRQYWKLVARRPGNERVASELLERLKRANKLVLNGWDDANGDDVLQYPDECTGAGLQMGERALTGEIGSSTGDRDHDCVKDISQAKHPASLGALLVLTRK